MFSRPVKGAELAIFRIISVNLAPSAKPREIAGSMQAEELVVSFRKGLRQGV
jgi:hypothetical protein